MTVDVTKLTAVIWIALKEQACINPKTAVRIVTLNEQDVLKAVEASKNEILQCLIESK